jgi:cytochrome oxidase Cu insertion factor (SCO1/SenC/PrrC family)
VLISFDPLNDTPEVLKAFGRRHGLDLDRIDLLVSDVETIKRLMVRELEIPISIDVENDSFANHALMVHVINKDGYVVVERTAQSSARISMLLDEAMRAAEMVFTPPDNGQ